MQHGTFYFSAQDAAAQRCAVTATQTDGGTAPTVSTQTLVLHSGIVDGSTAGTGTAPRECWGHVVEHFNLNDLFQTRTQHSGQQGHSRGQQGDCARNNFIHSQYMIHNHYVLTCYIVTLVMRDRDVVKILFRNVVGV